MGMANFYRELLSVSPKSWAAFEFVFLTVLKKTTHGGCLNKDMNRYLIYLIGDISIVNGVLSKMGAQSGSIGIK